MRSISIVGLDKAIAVDDMVPLEAKAYDQSGNLMSGISFSWSTSDSSIASITNTKSIMGLSEGICQLTASAEGKSISKNISVIPSLKLISRYEFPTLHTNSSAIAAKTVYIYIYDIYHKKIIRFYPGRFDDTAYFNYNGTTSQFNICSLTSDGQNLWSIVNNGSNVGPFYIKKLKFDENNKTFKESETYTMPENLGSLYSGICWLNEKFFLSTWGKEDIVVLYIDQAINLVVEKVYKGTSLTEAFGIAYDGKYFWIANNFWKLSAHNINDLKLKYSYSVGGLEIGEPNGICYDGTYLWTINGSSFVTTHVNKYVIKYSQ